MICSRTPIFPLVSTIVFLFFSEISHGEASWPNWRGSQQNGNAGDGKFPIKWSESENVEWKIALPGRGCSTPIVVADSIFLTTGSEGQNRLLRYDLTGKLLWQVAVGTERSGKHAKASGSNPSAVSDGESVFAYFKSGDLACCDLGGKIIWQRNLQAEFGEDTLWWDLGTSPVLTKDAVIVAVMQSGPSFIVSFDKNSGRQLWKVDRELNANQESNQAYTTPAIARTEQGEILFALGADHVTAHDTQTGKELWRVGGFNPDNHQNYRCIASPLVVDNLVICPYARGQLVTAVRYDPGISDKMRVAWQLEKIGADVPTPACQDNRIYFITDKGEATCVEASTGRTIWTGSLPKSRTAYSSSPILAGGYLYLQREDGTAFVLKAGDQFEVVAENSLDMKTVATPVFIGNNILIRTFESLYCISEGS
jgi:outer membrane protein assembly factor BamB